jgi:hypothetical protein
MTALAIQSVGAPPEQHADRVVAEMMKYLAQKNARLWDAIHALTKGPHVRDGNPRAQAKIQTNIEALGVSWTHLEPGKRGRYRLSVNDWAGWNPATDSRITLGDEIPSKPWLANLHHVIEGTGHGWVRFASHVSLLITHHSLSRVTQRWQVRTLADLLRVIETIGAVALGHIAKIDDGTNDNWYKTPASGIRVPFPNHSSVMVLKQHETHKALVVTTIF